MGLFNRKKTTTPTMEEEKVMPDFEQVIAQKTVKLEKVFDKIETKKGVNLKKHMAKVRVDLDYSGSMSNHYKNGVINQLLTRLLPLGLKFDDNSTIELLLFTEGYYHMPDVTIQNCQNYYQKNQPGSKFYMGGTDYSPVLKEMLKMHQKESSDGIPSYIIFITDGGCSYSDEEKTNQVLAQIAEENIFVMFVGIGNDDFRYLKHLDTFDNTDFIQIGQIDKISDEELYSLLLEEYSTWVKNWVK